MLEENGTFKIDSSISHSELENLHKEILENIKEIKTIEIEQTGDLGSSALISLLKTIKFNQTNISIPLIDNQEGFLKGAGKFEIIDINNSAD